MGCGASSSDSGRLTRSGTSLFRVYQATAPNLERQDSTESLPAVADPVSPSRDVTVDHGIIPEYWHNKKTQANDEAGGSFDDMFYVPDSDHARFDQLLAASYVNRTTQDRACPKLKSPCERKPGGCECNQPDGDPGLPVGFRVQRVIRVEASSMWDKYSAKRNTIVSKRPDNPPLDPALMTSNFCDQHTDLFSKLNHTSNEGYSFHGTFVRSALSITQTDFRIDLAGSNRGTLYGNGIYLAESITKADEYAKDEPGGYYSNVFAVLVCRVCMGKYYKTGDDPKAEDKVKNGEFDSTVGQRMFRELVVYDAGQLYPEYVIVYKRVYKKNADAYIASLLKHRFFMEVPLHWRNNAKTLQEGFQEQHLGLPGFNEYLQVLVNMSMQSSSQAVRLSARIENSVLWTRYVEFKDELRKRLGGRDGAQADDGTISLGALQGDIEACRYSNDAGASSMARAAGWRLPVNELDSQCNEHLLWFAGTKDESVRLTKGYFNAEDATALFSQSLKDAVGRAQNENGATFAVLCRVVCGVLKCEGKRTSLRDVFIDTKTDCEALEGVSTQHEVAIGNPSQVYPEYVVGLFSQADGQSQADGLDMSWDNIHEVQLATPS